MVEGSASFGKIPEEGTRKRIGIGTPPVDRLMNPGCPICGMSASEIRRQRAKYAPAGHAVHEITQAVQKESR